MNERDNVVFASPGGYDEKAALANRCARQLGLDLPALVDGFDNAVEVAYTAWPDRLYVIDGEGKVAYKSRPGPFGFHPAEVDATLERLLGP